MALARVDKISGTDTTDLTTYTTASVSLSAGEDALAWFAITRTGATPSVPTSLTGAGQTWTLHTSLVWGTTVLNRLCVYRAHVTSGGSGTLTLTCAEGQAGALWSIYAFTGAHATPFTTAVTATSVNATITLYWTHPDGG